MEAVNRYLPDLNPGPQRLNITQPLYSRQDENQGRSPRENKNMTRKARVQFTQSMPMHDLILPIEDINIAEIRERQRKRSKSLVVAHLPSVVHRRRKVLLSSNEDVNDCDPNAHRSKRRMRRERRKSIHHNFHLHLDHKLDEHDLLRQAMMFDSRQDWPEGYVCVLLICVFLLLLIMSIVNYNWIS